MTIDLGIVWNILKRNWPFFLSGVKYTCLLAVLGTAAGFVIGLILGGIRAIRIEPHDKPIVKAIKEFGVLFARFYIWVFRGTPMMVQAIFIYYLFRPVLHWNNYTAALVILSLNTAAYMAEIIRAGIQSIDPGQLEASRSIGLTFFQSLISIIMPQAIKNSFPSIGNELIVNIKDTSILNVISVTELYYQSNSIAGSNFRFVETFLITAAIYLFLTTIASTILNYIEKRLNIENKKVRIMGFDH